MGAIRNENGLVAVSPAEVGDRVASEGITPGSEILSFRAFSSPSTKLHRDRQQSILGSGWQDWGPADHIEVTIPHDLGEDRHGSGLLGAP